MSTVLVLNTSTLGGASVSRALVGEAVARLRQENASLSVIERDLAATPVPHLDADATAAIRNGATENEAQRKALALSDTLIAELRAADTLIIGAPMYNFGIPSTLKSWFDYVLRPRVTFAFTEAAPRAWSRASALSSSRRGAGCMAKVRPRRWTARSRICAACWA